MQRAILYGFLYLLPVFVSASNALGADKRVALVIGNSAYQHAGTLANPTNDAADMAATLRKLDFEVIERSDLDKTELDRTIRQFARQLTGASVGLFFYAGHGLQVDGQNYLVPTDAKLDDASGLDFELVRIDTVQKTMERATRTNLIFLDACRDNPLARNLARSLGTRTTAIGRGLAPIESGEGTLISFSTAPGTVAADGTGRNSPYAAALVKQISSSRDELSSMLIRVRNQVIQETGRRQVPWEHTALTASFYFLPPGSPAPDPHRLSPAPSYEQQAELAFWASVKDSRSAAIIQTYVDRFPKGTFAGLAQALIAQLKAEAEQNVVVSAREADLQKAEEARRAAERQRAEAERTAAQAKQAEELQKAREAARLAREALAIAEKEREVALKAAEAARQAQDEARKAVEATAQQTRVASIPDPRNELASEAQNEKLVRELQLALKRVGCDPGSADGKWGSKAKAALAEFAKRTKVALATDEPSPAALELISGRKGRVCPLICGDNEVENNGQCVARPRSRAAEQPSAKAQPTPQPKDSGLCFSADAHSASGRSGGMVRCK
jgi:uncharacterized caspase-like protein